jgi:hypothetical protein
MTSHHREDHRLSSVDVILREQHELQHLTAVDETEHEVILYKPKKKKTKTKTKTEKSDDDDGNNSKSQLNAKELMKKKRKSSSSKSTKKDRHSSCGDLSIDMSELTHKTVRTAMTTSKDNSIDHDDEEQPTVPQRIASVVFNQQEQQHQDQQQQQQENDNIYDDKNHRCQTSGINDRSGTSSNAVNSNNVGPVRGGGGDSSGHNMGTLSCRDRINYRVRSMLKQLLHFRVLKIFQVLCAIYICIMTLKGDLLDPDTGVVIDPNSDERTESGVVLIHGIGKKYNEMICLSSICCLAYCVLHKPTYLAVISLVPIDSHLSSLSIFTSILEMHLYPQNEQS